MFQDGEIVKQDILLRTHPQLLSDRRQVCLQVLAVDDDGSRSGRVESRQQGSISFLMFRPVFRPSDTGRVGTVFNLDSPSALRPVGQDQRGDVTETKQA